MSKAADIAKKHGKALAQEMLDEVLEPALAKVVADSENKIDDTVYAVLKEPLKLELKKLIEAL